MNRKVAPAWPTVRHARSTFTSRPILPIVADILALRRQRLCGQHIALKTQVSPATVSRALKRAGLSRLKDLAPR